MKRDRTWAGVLDHGRETLKRGFSAWVLVIKLMIPALVLTRLLLYFELIGPLSRVFEPVMALVGLPPETALVWVSGMVANLYVAISVYLALNPLLDPALTLAQMTILGGMCLMAHSLLVEGQICRGAGLSFWRVSVFRIFSGFLWGVLIYKGAGLFGWGAEPTQVKDFMNMVSEPVPPWSVWLWLNLKQLFFILALIESLMILMEIIKYFELTRVLAKVLGPPLRLAGVSDSAMMVTIIGCVVGLAYGGGLIVAESRSGHLTPRDIFGSVMLMCVFHSMLEDTLLMWALGGSFWCFLVLRLVLALVLTALVTRLALRPFWRPLLVGRSP
ncbi:MAG: hypothetical protein LBC90_06530 [Candidatus Adiutrix sp.]|jgi:hypothetical protein|nr:hypothetical protein [Candidatus Adiutrix sp.]